jgi:hypothetical protein
VKKSTLQEQEWNPYQLTPEDSRAMLAELDRSQQMRCWYAAKDMRLQCYMWPLLDIRGNDLPPTARWGTATDVTLQMMESA